MGADLSQSALFTEAPITEFSGEHRFLSNFYVHEPVLPQGPWWTPEVAASFPSVEHAFQAAKVEPGTEHFAEHYSRIASAGMASMAEFGQGSPDPGLAKRLGSARGFERAGATLRTDWEQIKVPVMLACLRAKFEVVGTSHEGRYAPEPVGLTGELIATSPRVLVEGNTWNDTYWGVCRGKGKNMLGRLLMLRRAEVTCALAAGMLPRELAPWLR